MGLCWELYEGYIRFRVKGSGFRVYFFGGPYEKDYNILGSILWSPYLGKLLYTCVSLS